MIVRSFENINPEYLVEASSEKANGRETKTCLGRVFNSKLGCFNDAHALIYVDTCPYLLTRGMACVIKCFESKISKPTKLDCKQNFYCTAYYITLYSNCEAQKHLKF